MYVAVTRLVMFGQKIYWLSNQYWLYKRWVENWK